MEGMSYTQQIIELLKDDKLTSDEIADKLEISKQDARTYLLRLKNEDKVMVIGKRGRFYVYTLKVLEDSLREPKKEHVLLESVADLSEKFYEVYKDTIKMKDEYIESLEESFNSKLEYIESLQISNEIKKESIVKLEEENNRLKAEIKVLKKKIQELTDLLSGK